MYGQQFGEMRERNVVIYARVSTEHEAQLSALENQKDWYTPFLEHHPEWHLIHTYIDEGITGTSAEKRPEFMKMLEDAEDGDFDLILTREVSRFARNTVDTLQYTRKLKAIGVEVFFINDNIKTFDGDGELRLTIMATLAQDESRKTSIRVKSGQKVSMEKGVLYGNGNILGYDRVGKELIINPEQAKTVRMIFDWYLDGWGLRKIQFELEKLGRLTSTGKTKWHAATIGHILKNPFYCGTIVYRKQFVPDFLEQKKINNYGEVEQITTQGTHEAIISEEEYERAMAIMESHRRVLKNNTSGQHNLSVGERQPIDVWVKLLECECGHKFNRKVWHKKGDITQYGYQCYSSIRSGTVQTRLNKGLPIDGICTTPMVSGWKFQMMAKFIFQEYLTNTNEILKLSMEMLNKHIGDEKELCDNSDIIAQKEAEKDKLNKRLDNLIEMRADGEINRETFKTKQKDIQDKLDKIESELLALCGEEEDVAEEVDHESRITLLKYALEQLTNFDNDEDIPEQVIEAFVKKIIVKKDGFEWYLRFSPDDNTPTKVNVDGKRQNTAKVSLLCDMPHRQQFTKVGNAKYVKIVEFSVTLDDAKRYLYSKSNRSRILKWYDFNVSIFV